MSQLSDLKEKAFKNPAVKAEYDRLANMTLDDLRQERRLSWRQVSNQLSELTRGKYGVDYLHPHRLWLLRTGQRSPREHETKALLEWSGLMLDSFRDVVA